MVAVASASADITSNSTSPIAVALTVLRPVAPQPGDTLVLRGTMTNTSLAAVTTLAVQLRMSDPVGARSTFDDYAADPAGSVSDLPIALGTPQPLRKSSLGPGQQESFEIDAALDPATTGLSTTNWEVRELGVDVTGLTSLGEGSVGSLRTFLPWAPRDVVGPKRLDVAWLWPLVDRPHRDSSTVWRDDDLAQELGSGGRLSTLLDAATAAANQAPPPPPTQHGRPVKAKHHKPAAPPARDVAVTWAIDPMLIDDVDVMRNGYQVAHSPQPAAGSGSAAARTWLSTLRSATDGAEVIALPYGDPDVASAVRNGLSTLVGLAATAGRSVIEHQLPTAQLVDAGWPPDGLLDQHAVDALFSDGASSLVLSDQALPPVTTPNQTPSALASLVTVAGDIPTVLSDSILSDAITEGAATPGDSRATLQRYLAETLMIEAEAPSISRNILIAPQRRWEPSAALATSLLADTGKVPWLSSTTVGAILAGRPDNTVVRQPLTYPTDERRAELPASYVEEVAGQQHELSELTNILPPGDSETRPFSTTLLRALSSAWRGQTTARNVWIGAFNSELTAMTNGVRIVSARNSTVTLTGHGGKVPVTIANSLDAPASITVQLDANQRLSLPNKGRVKVTIPADRQTTVDVHATAKTSGVFPLNVQLLTPSGEKYGSPVQLYVRSTVYGTITLVITGVAMAALLIAVGIRLTRRALAARRAAALVA